MVSRLLLALGYFAVPFAGPGAAVITSAGWLSLGVETRNQLWAGIGLVGLFGVAGILSAYHSEVLAGLAGVGGIALLFYLALAVVGLWMLGSRTNNWFLKIAAAAFALSWLFAVVAPTTVSEAAAAASGGIIDWAGTEWASQAARDAIAALGGPVAIAKALATLGGLAAGIGFLTAPQVGSRNTMSEEAIFSLAYT